MVQADTSLFFQRALVYTCEEQSLSSRNLGIPRGNSLSSKAGNGRYLKTTDS